jgi:hypothetical protein
MASEMASAIASCCGRNRSLKDAGEDARAEYRVQIGSGAQIGASLEAFARRAGDKAGECNQR